MATRITDTRDRFRSSHRGIEPAPYAGRGAGLYSEVSWAPVAPRGERADRSLSDDDQMGPRS
ncbi:hypothetical protein [Brevundimonas lenta]|uniref:Uncharacterized protein n=1 Tax=Brevundimonas lenta TaxID=424796 RepID=A0A7W6JFE7_9CAUL|nr:hypothetical protein [Brevundimonas lenta]MBB4084143.1 hypothetical protein [Brevundimonas lenta]